MRKVHELAARIRLVIFDVDGVLTDGSLFIGDDGQEYKAFNSRDGHGIKMLQTTGVHIAVTPGRTSEVVKHRMADLDVEHVYQGQRNKLVAFERLVRDLSLDLSEIA